MKLDELKKAMCNAGLATAAGGGLAAADPALAWGCDSCDPGCSSCQTCASGTSNAGGAKSVDVNSPEEVAPH